MHVLFVDLAEAYDRVDRKILLYRLSQLGFPIEFLDFLKDYYSGDNISSKSGGRETLKQYLLRGLRQGCNLSSILFILYITELADRLEKAGVGPVLRGKLINSLFFADDLSILADNEEDLKVLITVLEKWCKDFKMKVSIKKTKIVGPDSDSVWVLKDHELNNETLIEMTPSYEYLGVLQFKTTMGTARNKATEVLKRMRSYHGLMNIQKFFLPDTISSFLAIWTNILLPSVLYGLDVIPIHQEVLLEMELLQIKMGKVLMGVPSSTAHVAVSLILGLKPIGQRILKSRLKFILKAKSMPTDRLIRICWDYHEQQKDTLFWIGTEGLLQEYSMDSPESITVESINAVDTKVKSRILQKAGDLKSMELVEIPKTWWKRQIYVQNTEWSRMLVRFMAMNAGFGNRESGFQDYAVTLSTGRVVLCPICTEENNNEVHSLVVCKG